MSRAPTKDKIKDDGLRFKAKVGGSPFPDSALVHNATMSCYLCGKHRPRAQLKTRKFLGKTQYVCAPFCKERNAE